jgi:hypothetical protein
MLTLQTQNGVHEAGTQCMRAKDVCSELPFKTFIPLIPPKLSAPPPTRFNSRESRNTSCAK